MIYLHKILPLIFSPLFFIITLIIFGLILSSKKISAISTSNLLNFVGDGLKILREELIKKEIDLPVWG